MGYHLLLHAGKGAWGDAVTRGVDKKRVGVLWGILPSTDSVSAYSEGILGELFERAMGGGCNGLECC